MTNKIVVLTTTASLPEARRIAMSLVEARLAACVNISSPVTSVYRWQGKIAGEKEYLLIIKTRRELFPGVRDAILEVHSYATPEIITLPVSAGSRDYLSWIDDCVTGTTKKGRRAAQRRPRLP